MSLAFPANDSTDICQRRHNFLGRFLIETASWATLVRRMGFLIRLLQFTTAFDGFGQRHVVGIFDIHADRNAIRNS